MRLDGILRIGTLSEGIRQSTFRLWGLKFLVRMPITLSPLASRLNGFAFYSRCWGIAYRAAFRGSPGHCMLHPVHMGMARACTGFFAELFFA